MTGPVVTGYDGGASGTDALTLASWTAQTLGVPLIVAVVHPAPAALGSGRVDAEWVADRHRAATLVLDGARAALEGAAVEADYRLIASSSAAHGLHDLAEQEAASLLVVGAGGSTAERLLAGTLCPVAVAPSGLTGPLGKLGRVGVAYVDTPDGRRALEEAARMAARTGAELRLYTVVAEADASLPFLIGDDAERAFLETARETYEQSLSRAAETVPNARTDWRIESGDVVEKLATLTDVDILFCGSRGYGPARRVLLGGVSTRLIRRARLPVVVVPRSG
ncbi:universal stress protein [Paractinoplanes atraurantiacus]|uniref:Nucleotide-binding universal stress protein, UspA family n=1 Tax=Paractinoplanes atraurantiacus TaxID=1036182 RepID=A0A285IP09_9ACTN|nr:universal stress protein [Actinoplanes atraurantiacus]SNY48701.1 Nucleotide-binding universal stress protein, UspA family [Actinoplanes atraurantiacus]